jgi:hypothetical protein
MTNSYSWENSNVELFINLQKKKKMKVTTISCTWIVDGKVQHQVLVYTHRVPRAMYTHSQHLCVRCSTNVQVRLSRKRSEWREEEEEIREEGRKYKEEKKEKENLLPLLASIERPVLPLHTPHIPYIIQEYNIKACRTLYIQLKSSH